MFKEMTQLLNRIVDAVDSGDNELILNLARKYATLHKLVRSNPRCTGEGSAPCRPPKGGRTW